MACKRARPACREHAIPRAHREPGERGSGAPRRRDVWATSLPPQGAVSREPPIGDFAADRSKALLLGVAHSGPVDGVDRKGCIRELVRRVPAKEVQWPDAGLRRNLLHNGGTLRDPKRRRSEGAPTLARPWRRAGLCERAGEKLASGP